MPTAFSDADARTLAMLDSSMERWHSALKKAKVQIGVVMASNPDGPAVKHGGYPAAATIKVVSLKDRLKKKYDAELTIDESVWDDMVEDGRYALLDHELSHLSLIPNKPKKGQSDNGTPWKYDDLGRPKLKTIKANWNVGDGFEAVVERHGESAMEFLNLKLCYGKVSKMVSK